jgi:hypothetical protein
VKNRYNLARRGTLVALALTAPFAFGVTVKAQAPPGSLWYNGDFDSDPDTRNALANGNNTGFTAAVYDDFNVTGGQWLVTGVFSNNLLNTNAGFTTANWEIRSGVSEGNPGTLVASGLNAPVVVTPTGRSWPQTGLIEYTFTVAGLAVTLNPGTYWLNVQPNGNGSQISYNSSTMGANCVGTPCGNDMNAFIDSITFGYNFHTTADPIFGPGNVDFSDGVIGTVVPEPATVALLTCGLGALVVANRRRRA